MSEDFLEATNREWSYAHSIADGHIRKLLAANFAFKPTVDTAIYNSAKINKIDKDLADAFNFNFQGVTLILNILNLET